MADAIADLEEYYRTVTPSANPISSRLMPDPVPLNIPLPDQLVINCRFPYKGDKPHSRRSVFRGTLQV